MGIFTNKLASARPSKQDVRERHWMYVPYDKLTDQAGPLFEIEPKSCGIVMVESLQNESRRPYHKKKLALVLANGRHFALEQAARGVKVIYVSTQGSFGDGLLEAQEKFALAELTSMHPAERELRIDLEQSIKQGLRLKFVGDTTWLSTNEDFDSVYKSKPKQYVMDRFYRAMRTKTGLLMDGSGPVGGKFSYDAENRKPYRGEVPVPQRPVFETDDITREVLALVENQFPNHFGTLEGFSMPVNAKDAEALWRFALDRLLPHFGPWEDAMDQTQLDLFHSKLSALINLSRVLPGRVVADVATAYEAGRIPLASAEGFIRQILGWREYMRHIHRLTDGYRGLNVTYEKRDETGLYAGAAPSHLDAARPLPAVYWGVKSGMNCMDTVVEQVVDEGWSHHITRLMVLSNLANLCGFSPRELTDWFWIAYVDAYDWVVESNVLGMGTYADGGLTATKPYVSGAAYINKMSNYCKGCQFDPKKATGEGSCPFTALYWSFLERNSDKLSGNIRMAMPYVTLRKKSAQERTLLRARAEQAIADLERVARPSYAS